MGSIVNRDGRWRAQVRRKGHPAKCRTFATKTLAQQWVRQLESAIDSGAEVAPSLGSLTIGDVIRAYRKLRDGARPISDSSTEHYLLKALERGLGTRRLAGCTPDDLVGFAMMRRDEGAGPYTINMDISKLGTVLRYGCAVLKVAPPDLVGAARPILAHLRLIGGGGKRERRPTEDELHRVLEHLRTKYGAIYADAAKFAAITAMRRGEVTSIRRVDLDHTHRMVSALRKHPRKGKVQEWVPLLGQSWDIAMRQPEHESGRIFPIEAGTLSKYFTWTCRALAIPDLHLHDLRHEGTSAMFEDGMTIEQVALVTGHTSWNMLKRYTQLRPQDVKRPAPASHPETPPRPDSRRSVSRRRGKS